jgi:ferredoxin-NADP reductase
VPERGATPNVPVRRRAVLRFLNRFTAPLLIDDYLELFNPLWSSRELRGKVEHIERQTEDACSIVIKPGWEWEGHEPGQYLRIGFDIEGRRHWRAYSLTSDPADPEGNISITVKPAEGGAVSPYLVRKLREGSIVTLGEVTGQFTLPREVPDKLLFISAGSGITPIMSMIRDLADKDELVDTIHIHSARTSESVIFGDELRKLDKRRSGFTLHEQHTGENGRFGPGGLEERVPDWKERLTFISGPSEMLDDFVAHWEEHGDPELLNLERFQPVYGEGGDEGDGGRVRFATSDKEAEAEPGQSILVAGEELGLDLPYGCRMGICHTCVCSIASGNVRDLRSGEVSDASGQSIRICINAPEGAVEVEA